MATLITRDTDALIAVDLIEEPKVKPCLCESIKAYMPHSAFRNRLLKAAEKTTDDDARAMLKLITDHRLRHNRLRQELVRTLLRPDLPIPELTVPPAS